MALTQFLDTETVEGFLDRIYVDFIGEKVWVYPRRTGIGECEAWTLEQAKQYVRYLKQKEDEDVMI